MSLFATAWQVGIRERCNGLLSVDSPFLAIPNSVFYWAADPFPFEYAGETYVFAELYDYFHGRGTIGYCKRNPDGSFTKWKQIIKEKWHLSFPNIYEENGSIYIIPESYQSRKLYAYKAVHFPDKWEKAAILCDRYACADTVFYRENGKTFGITLKQEKAETCMQLFSVVDGKAYNFRTVSWDMSFSRNAGKIIWQGEKKYRVFQDCKNDYGKRIGFSEILAIDDNLYEERIVRYTSLGDAKIAGIDKKRLQGIHTYNISNRYECIDWKFEDHSIFGVLLHWSKQVYRKIRSALRIYIS